MLTGLRNSFPAAAQGDFAFYPILVLAISVVACFIVGLVCGFKELKKDAKLKFDFGEKPMGLTVLQTACCMSIVYSAAEYRVPALSRPGGDGGAVFIGYAGAIVFLMMLVTVPLVFMLINWMCFRLGMLPAILCRKFLQWARGR